MVGYIHSIESFATYEGSGIRTAVFMRGCPLRCKFCHNPDTWDIQGEGIESEALVKRLLRFKTYFSRGGGITFSGGEPLVQTDFLIETSLRLKENGINVAIDTSESIFNEKVKNLYQIVDLVIADLKFNTRETYASECCVDIYDTVLETLKYLNEINKPVILRTVIIPGINDSEEAIKAYYELVKEFKNIQKYELKAFHTLGFDKYTKLGILNPYANKSALNEKRLDELKLYLAQIR
ncbi:MAG: radical SAM protein [Christensenellaceae bacterium]|jgi:pyruvate formate lyase activating enzyme|nr:radical SAM protein [Christensenellaceae bacterium]